MKNSLKGKGRLLILLLAFVLCIGIGYSSNTFASTATHTINNGLKDRLLHGDVDSTISWVTANPISGGYSKKMYFEPETCIVTSSNPSVLAATMEELSYDPGAYKVVVTALSPGTAVVTFHWPEDGVIIEETVQVAAKSEVRFAENLVDCTMNKGTTKTLENVNEAFLDDRSLGYFNIKETTVTSSNSKAVKVYKDDNKGYFGDCYLKAVGPGTSLITITVVNDPSNPELNGISRSFNVTVKQGAKATAPVLLDQTTCGSYVYYNRMDVGFRIKDKNAIYEIWRSTSPSKNFKRVGSFTKPMFTIGTKAYFDDFSKKYKLKANTKYYYKMRVKYTDEYYDNSWSKWSKVKAYWTAPAPIADKKVKLNRNTRQVTIPKTKNVSGFIYTVGGIKKLGYNVFGQTVYYTENHTRTTSKRIFKASSVQKMRPVNIRDVKPYAKHGKYYYAHGYKPVKKLSSYKAKDGHKFAS